MNMRDDSLKKDLRGKRAFCLTLCVILLLSQVGCGAEIAAEDPAAQAADLTEQPLESGGVEELPAKPINKPGGGKFRIGFIDLDPYPYSAMMLYDVVEGLKADGWISYAELPFDRENTDAKELIDWLSKQDLGAYVEFAGDANYYTLVDGEDVARSGLAAHAAAGDVDLMLAWATGPALLAAEFAEDIPVIAYPISDPIGGGIIKGVEYSGVKNVWAHMDTMRFPRQMQVFHEIQPFSKMGAIYYSESVSSIKDYEGSAAELGVALETRVIPQLATTGGAEDSEAERAYYADFFRALEELFAAGIDAFLLTNDMMKNEAELQRMIELCTARGIPIFVQSGDNFVEAGCLMTVQIIDSADVGRFVANTIGKVLNGAKPEELLQTYVSTPYLVLNLDACKALEIDLPFEMLVSCEKIYASGAQ